MRTVGSYEAKTMLPALLGEVERGETITITRHGHPVAYLVPVGPEAAAPHEVIAALREARRGVRRGRTSVRKMVEDGRP